MMKIPNTEAYLHTFRYIDDLISIYNPIIKDELGPSCLELEETFPPIQVCSLSAFNYHRTQ